MTKRWQIAERLPEEFRLEFPEMDPVVLQLLWARGVRTQEEMDLFLGPDWSRDVFSPFQFRNMEAAVGKVFEVLEAGEVITVHGDYDADGVCGSAVSISTLREICRAFGFDGTKITSFIPDREKDGYGMSVATVEHLHVHDRTKLIITVDCGISNKAAIDRAKELGIDTIVCDHHTMPAELPESAILIHPLVPGETYPNKLLCGTGVAFKLACGLLEEARRRQTLTPSYLPLAKGEGTQRFFSSSEGESRGGRVRSVIAEGHEKWLLDLVAIATVTDVMPLIGENRVLETFGLKVLNKTRRTGLKKLIEIAGGNFGKLDTYSIGFQIGPRINAAGRMNHASAALNVLLEEDELRATVLAKELNDANIARQRASDAMYKEALEKIGEIEDQKLVIVYGDGWPAGLVGLVAGKLVNVYGRPVYVVGKQGEKYVGSGRSVEGFDVTECLRAAAEHLDKFGGHPQACGFSTTGDERFAQAVVAMRAYAETVLKGRELVPTIKVDAEIELEDVTWELFDQLERFAPFGEGNPRPLFVSSGKVVGISTVGADGKHLRLSLTSNSGKMVKLIGFGFGEWSQKAKLGDCLEVVYDIGVNEWDGNRELQLRILDIRYWRL
jgi:single-stranded-DNA-specific exonuclease